MVHTVTPKELRSFLIHYHSLDCLDRLAGEAGIKELFRRIGSIQYDPLDIVGRNPHLALQSRVKGFTAAMLDKLLYEDRFLVDAWDKEMSIYRTEDWPCFGRVRRCRGETVAGWLTRRGQKEALSYTVQVLKKLKDEGPAMSSGINLGKCHPNSWGHRKNAGAALDYLCAKGDIGVCKKKNARKVYDLIENLLPRGILDSPDPFKNDNDFYEWYFLRRIKSMGIHWLKNGGGWNGFYLSDSVLRRQVFEALEKKGVIERIEVPEVDECFYICGEDAELLHKKPDYDNSIKIMAPLDNLLWDRALIRKVFDFQYTWEVYVPAAKRMYGYYVLPILYRDRFIARMEPVKQKPGNPLAIKNWWWEPDMQNGGKPGARLKTAVEKGLKRFAGYLNLDGVDKKVEKLIF